MKITKQLLIVLVLTSFGLYSSAQTLIQRDPEIEKMVKEVNAD